MIQACLYVCGPLIGYFPDKHKSPENSDDEDQSMDVSDDEMLKKEGRIVQRVVRRARARKKRAKETKAKLMDLHLGTALKSTIRTSLEGSGIGLVWTPFLVNTYIEVPHSGAAGTVMMSVQGVKARDEQIPKSLMEKLDTISQVYIFDVVNGDLQELPEVFCKHLENLLVLKLSRNKISCLDKSSLEIGSGKQSKLKELMVDSNKLQVIKPGALANNTVASLMLLDLARNELEILPLDFMAGAVELRFMDLSYNRLTVLPQSILHCAKLQVFHASNNFIKELPELGALRELRKLFLSYNQIEGLPESIGDCSKLTKLRLTANVVHVLPRSCIKLWKKNGGMLEELLIDGNPMQQPSITAYELGGLDQCFALFADWIQSEEAKERQELERLRLEAEEALKAQQQASAEQIGRVDVSPRMPRSLPALMTAASSGDAGAVQNMAAHATHATVNESTSAESDVLAHIPFAARARARARARALLEEKDHVMQSANGGDDEGKNFYFSSFHQGSEGNSEIINEIRQIQSMCMFMKKKHFVEKCNRLALQEQPHRTDLWTVASYKGAVPKTDIDTYFALLVYAMKPMYPSCQAIFNRFVVETPEQTKAEADLKKEEWASLCKRSPVRIPEGIQEKMFRAMSYSRPECVSVEEFVAVWQVHDVEDKDPWVQRMASVLHLEYFDTTVEDLSREFAAKSAANEVASADRAHAVGQAKQEEGGRWQNSMDMVPAGLEELTSRGTRTARDSHREPPTDLIKVSMSDMEYAIRQQQEAQNDPNEPRSDCEESDNLSIEEDTQDSDFDAVARMAEVASLEQERVLPRAQKAEHFQVQNDEDLRKLMELPAEQIGVADDDHAAAQGKATIIATQGRYTFRAKGRTKVKVHDPRFNTDMLNVRQALREAKRNLPLKDYTALVDYLMRGLRQIKFAEAGQVTYWNCQDPVFAHTIRGNRYTESVLIDMGFIMVNDTYWVWPEKHLSADADQGDWGHLVISSSCPGTHQGRLDDVLKLLTHVQKQIVKIRKGPLQ